MLLVEIGTVLVAGTGCRHGVEPSGQNKVAEFASS